MLEENALVVGRGAFIDAEEIFALTEIALIITGVGSFDDDAVAFSHLFHRFGKLR